MEWQQWCRQWEKLARQEGELVAGCASACAGAAATPREPGWQTQRDGSAAQQLCTQLSRHLNAADALRAAGSNQLPAPALERRWQQCAAALAGLQASCAAHAEELAPAEQEAAADWDAAAQHVQQLLAAVTQGPGACPEGSQGAAHSNSATATAAAAGKSAEDGLPLEITALDAFMQRQGSTGGWHPDDHAEFERILRACRGNYAHCTQLCQEELGLLHGAEDIARHAAWHQQLQKLQLNKRLAVQRWRLQKQAQQAALLEQQQQQQQQLEGAVEPQSQRAAEEREQQRAALEEWKRSKEEQRAKERLRHKEEEQEERRRELLGRQQRQQENRQLLEQRRFEKEAKEGQHTMPSAESSTSSSSLGAAADNPGTRQRLCERNQQLLRRRAEQRQRRGALAAQQAARVEVLQRHASEQFAGAAERDPHRLLQVTSTAAMRQLEALSEERTAKDSGYIRNVPRRASPSWCTGARLQ